MQVVEFAKKNDITLQTTRSLVMKCPECGRLVRVGLDGRTRELLVLPAGQVFEERTVGT